MIMVIVAVAAVVIIVRIRAILQSVMARMMPMARRMWMILRMLRMPGTPVMS